MNRNRVSAAGMVLGLFLLAAVSGSAQPPTGTVRGLVTDASGGVVAGAAITVADSETSFVRSTSTGADGQFALPLLLPGSYRLEVEHQGYKKHVEPFTLLVGQVLRVDVALQVGALTEEVRVEAPAATLQHDSGALGTVVDNRQITGLPLDGRNFLELALLAPATAPAAQGSASSVRGDFAFSVAGGREDANGFLLDGVDNVDPKLNTPSVKPAVDAIREFEVLTSNYEAAIGRYAAGQVNVVLKSGTNQLSGTGYEFFRGSALSARNFFAPADEPNPDYRRNQFGFSIGGPIAKDRTFFFADYEGMRLEEGITQVTNVPTVAERNGDFSRSLLPAPINPFTGQPFPGGLIPDFAINPIGRAIANLYPTPNRNVPFQNYVSSPNQDDRNDQFDVRLDTSLGSGMTLGARYSFADRTLFEPFSGPAYSRVPGWGDTLERRAQNMVVSATSVLRPSLLNEARFGFNRLSSGVFQEGQGISVNNQVGLPERSPNPRDWGLSFITATAFSPIGQEGNNPQQSTINSLQIIDTMTWNRGRHLVKFGFDGRATRQDAYRDVQSRGLLTFTSQPVYTGNAMADVLLGLPVLTAGARMDNPQRLRVENYGLFVQDSLRLSSALTVTAGLRYEVTSPPVDANDRATLYDPSTGTLVQVGTNGVPRGGYETDTNNFAPRLGVAWTLDESARTVLRGGYGVFFNQSQLAPSEGLYFSPPYYNLNFYFPFPGLPPLTLYDPFPANFPLPTPPTSFSVQRDLKTPYLQHWNLAIERQLGSTRTIELAYIGSRGTSLVTGRDLNQPPPSTLPFLIRPNPSFSDIVLLESAGRSRYDAFQARFEQRTVSGLSVLASYTFGKSLDDASGFFRSAGDPNFPQDSNNLAAEYGRSGFDVRQRFSLSFSYELPFGRDTSGLAAAFARDWQVSGIVTLQTGRPFTVALLPDIDNSNTGRALGLGFGANDRPNLIGDPSISDPSPTRWFNTAAFAMPPYGSFGTAGRNIVEGPGYQNVNLAVLKNVPLNGDVRLQLRLEAFNLFNHTNFDLPDNFFGSPTFGQILSAQSPRRLQFGVKALF
jgi:Carboxypeptidase regulatory-like domain/TonB dependent receptor